MKKKQRTYRIHYRGLVVEGEANSPYHAVKKAIKAICKHLNTTTAPDLKEITITLPRKNNE